MKFALLAALALTCACASTHDHPIRYDAYLAGIGDGLRRARAEQPPRIEVSWTRGHRYLGTCRMVEGVPVIQINVADILDQSGSDIDAREQIARVTEHEVLHARLTCSDADHPAIEALTRY